MQRSTYRALMVSCSFLVVFGFLQSLYMYTQELSSMGSGEAWCVMMVLVVFTLLWSSIVAYCYALGLEAFEGRERINLGVTEWQSK